MGMRRKVLTIKFNAPNEFRYYFNCGHSQLGDLRTQGVQPKYATCRQCA